jgi:4,5-DOPA dioxygenase extradiol
MVLSVIRHLYPWRRPVIQLSWTISVLDTMNSQADNLRDKGVLIIGSGNMVHNLGMVAWDKVNEPEYGFDWALEASAQMKEFILTRDHKALIRYQDRGEAFRLAIPTPEHYLPLLYALALQEKDEEVSLLNDKAVLFVDHDVSGDRNL